MQTQPKGVNSYVFLEALVLGQHMYLYVIAVFWFEINFSKNLTTVHGDSIKWAGGGDVAAI